MKSKEEILDRNGFDFDAFQYENEDLAKSLLSAMEEYANQFQSDASSEEIRKWGKGCTNCGVSEVITDNHCNCCGAVQMSFLK